VHWSELHRAQKKMEPEYRRHGSPRSLAFNSMILLNPFALVASIWRVNRARETTPVGRVAAESVPPMEVLQTTKHDGANEDSAARADRRERRRRSLRPEFLPPSDLPINPPAR
jgi:hypothetical protein